MATKKAAKQATTAPVATKSERIDKSYRLLRYQPVTFTLKEGLDNKLMIFDENEGHMRSIRHCPNEKSIFIDDQSKNAVVEPIIFIKGFLHTKASQTTTQDFLDNHPSYGTVFEVIDEAGDAEAFAEIEDVKVDIKRAIREKVKEESGIEQLRIIASVLISDVGRASKMSPAELKTTLYELVDSNFNRFVDDDLEITIFDDADIVRQAMAQHAFNSGKIQVSSDSTKIMWADNKETITMVPVGKNHIEYFAYYLSTEEGLQVAREIERR